MGKKKRQARITCPICGHSFSKTNNLTRHKRYMHSKVDVAHKCMLCIKNRIFVHRRNLAAHLRKYHGKSQAQAKNLVSDCETVSIRDTEDEMIGTKDPIEAMKFEVSINAYYINENHCASSLNELWSQIANKKLNASLSSSSSTKRSSGRFSTDSTASGFGTDMQHQTLRQTTLAIKKTVQTKQLKQAMARDERQNVAKIQKSKEEIRLQRQQQNEETILGCNMANHSANFLLVGLPKDPVCRCCLESGNVMQCAGTCGAYFHKECLVKVVKLTEYNGILKQKMFERTEETANNEPASCIVENIDKINCTSCSTQPKIPCFVCSIADAGCILCCEKNCGKSYHIECLKYWPQHKKTYMNDKIKLTCPRHVCQMCVWPDIRNLFHSTESDKKLISCLTCPGTYHRSSQCIPAGSELLSESQLICARCQPNINLKRINVDFCIFCSEGGALICCDTCNYSFHQDCLSVPVEDYFTCEECESGRRPLNGDIVWCKYPKSPWWPAIIVPPPCIPDSVLDERRADIKMEPHQICVFFFGTNNYGWVFQPHIYFYLKEDGEFKNKNAKRSLKNAISEADQWMQRFKELNEKKSRQSKKTTISSSYKKIKSNKITSAKFEEAEYNECKCRPSDPAPCSAENKCENVASRFECHPHLCPAKEVCQNQNFRRGEQYAFEVKMTEAKGWGLFTKQEIPKGKFVIEYMGEVIDKVDFEHRFNQATNEKDDNYYFLTLGNNMYIDAKMWGNEARFINHSCDPNVAPNKWTVFLNGQEQIRIGFFSLRTILPGEEILFDYKWSTKNMRTVCQCGSKKCRGHIQTVI